MAGTSDVCDQTINFFVGCTRVSEGCQSCYAECIAARGFQPHHRVTTSRGRWTGTIGVAPESVWEKPRRRRKPTVYFVGSMTDWLHPNVPLAALERMFELFDETPRHTYELLTKRPERFAETFRALGREGPPANVWLGVTVESARWTSRLDLLRAIPASLRFMVAEPLLGPLGDLDLTGIGWVIAGAESGDGARRCDPAWLRELRDRCVAAGVPFYLKCWGGLLDGEPWLQTPDAAVNHR